MGKVNIFGKITLFI